MTAFVACTPSVTKDEPTPVSSSTIALFAPDSADPCKSVLPFPSDLAKDPVTKQLNIPYCREDTPEQTGMKTGLRTLDGYALGSTLTARFSAPIDAASAASAVKLFKATGEPVAFGAQFQGDTLYIQPAAPLAEATKYLVAITTDLKDAAGEPISPDQVFVFARSTEPLVDEQGYSRFAALPDANAYALEGLRQGLAPLFTGLEALGLERSKIAVAWAFTTQTAHAMIAPLAAMTAGSATAHWENKIPANRHALIAAAGIPAEYLCDVHTGRMELTDLLTPSGTFGADPATGAPLTGTAIADYILVTPNLDRDEAGAPLPCTTAWPADKLVVFAHGLGRCKNDVLALANGFAKAGYAVLAVDGPKAGARTLGTLGDQNLDGCADQPATPEFIALPGASANPFAVRDHLRQWALELVQVTHLARELPAQLAGLEGTTPAARLALVGHSWGGIAAALGRGEHGALDALVVNAASAELGAVFAPTIGATIAAQLELAGVPTNAEPGKTLLAQKTAESVAAFRWAMEPADPLYGGASTVPALVQVVSAGPAMADAALHATGTQQKLAAAFGESAETATFELSLQGAAICDDSTGVVGALLMPCVEEATSDLYPPALLQTAGLQRQAITFVATAPGGTPVVCDPDFTRPCP